MPPTDTLGPRLCYFSCRVGTRDSSVCFSSWGHDLSSLISLGCVYLLPSLLIWGNSYKEGGARRVESEV